MRLGALSLINSEVVMPVQIKDRSTADAANTFREKAAAKRAELLDPNKTFSADELRAAETEISAFEQRAAMIAGFTPDNEIEDQGGLGRDGVVVDAATRGAPEPEGRAKGHARRMEQLRKSVEDEFGGPNSLILALARRSIMPLTSSQQRVINEIDAMTKRTITAETGSDSGSEYLLPLQQVESIFSVGMSVAGILQKARRFSVRGRTLRIPYLVQSDGDTNRPMAGGIADVVIVGEGASKTEFEPKFLQRLLTVYKYAGYTEIADETLADDMTGELSPTIQGVIGGQIMNKVNEDMTSDGTGTAMPMGAFHANNASRYLQTRKTVNTFKVEDVFNMYAHHVLGPASTWYIHPSVVPQLMNMTLGGTTMVTWTTSLQGRPQMMLLGLPVEVTPLTAVLGTEADVCLGNAEFYAAAIRQALTIETSIHYRFRNDITAYRFFARAGGLPIPDGTYSYKASGSIKAWEVSPFVVLDNTATA
jgi:HK97 family phage major capsid protein